jgi:murein DD-endopeptidase MepM/ murein hydrolase activator NlpD
MQYKIKKGDTLSSISRNLGISVKDLASANKIKDVNKIQAGASLTIPQPKKKKSSSIEKVIPQAKNIESVQKAAKKTKENKSDSDTKKLKEKKESILPINVRQFFNPNEDRTQEDLSKSELKALREIIDYSQSEERRADKISRNVNPNSIEYSDYNAMEGVYAGDAAQVNSTGSILDKVTNPYAILKTTLGQATVNKNEDGTYQVTDKFDFKPKTDSTGLSKLAEYAQSIPEQGFNPYGQLRNYMGYYGPQEGTGQGGNINITAANGGLINYAKGGNMNIKQQTQNVANQGRYGDSMLLHVNPAEVKGLAQAMPITVNPETGQPEAFLPFLAPLLGSMAGTALFGGSALAAGIGAGLATYAQTGGSGSKALLSGLTAGFGTNALNTGAAASAGATAGTNAATNAATQGLDFAGQTAASQTANAAAQAAYQPQTAFSAGKDMFAGGFDQGAKSLATGLMSPSGMVAGASLGTQGVMNSQELYEQQMRQFEEDEEQRRRDMYANNPEIQLYSASGGVTGFEEGGFVSSIKSSARNLADRLSDDQFGYQSSRQVYAPAKTQYQVNPDFMAGFAPETMYFRPDTINAPSMSTLGGSRPTLGADTYTGTKGGYDYEGSVDADGNYVPGTAQGVQFAPQTSIDPYAAFTGSAPQGLVQSAYNPYPVQPMSMSPIDDTSDTSDYTDAGGIGEGGGDSTGGGGLYDGDQGYFSDLDLMGGDMGGFDPTSFMGASGVTNQYIQNQQIQEYLDSLNNPTTDIGDAFTADGPMGKAQGGVTNYANQGQTEIMPMDVMPEASAQPMQDPLIQEVTMFILGESDNEQAVNQFVDKYGVEAFSQLREQILQSLVPNAQTEGLIAGVGNGGMDDDIMGTIGNKEKIAVSQDEFIVPADVVSMLGDGSSDAGSKELYDMMDRVRQKKTGTTKQAPRLANAGGYLPA